MVISLNWTTLIDDLWLCVDVRVHTIKDMCLKDIRLRVPNMITILGFNINMIMWNLCDY